MKAFHRIISVSVCFLFIAGTFNSQAAVTITAPSLNIVTPSFPSGYNALGNIVITEGANADFALAAPKTLILQVPANFEFQAGVGSVSYAAGGNISAATMVVTATTITITYTVGNTNKPDAMTISGIMVRAINTASTQTVTRNGGTGTIAGLVNGTVVANLSSTVGCLHTIRLTDTFGDGWSGGKVTVTVNGVAVLTDIALAGTSGPEDFTFAASTGDVINVTKTVEDTYPDELNFEIIGGSSITLLPASVPQLAPGTNVTACCGVTVPGLATYTSPANGATGISVCSALSWTAPASTGCNAATSYDVYFGTAASPPLVTNTTATSYYPAMVASTTYYWKIVPKNSAGDAVGAATWSFTTSGTAAIYPGAVSGGSPKLWFKANAGVTLSGSNATDWSNQFSCSALTTLTGPGGDPLYISGSDANAINFNPVISFNGTTQYFQSAADQDFVNIGGRTGNAWSMESFAVVHGDNSSSAAWGWQPAGMVTPGNKCAIDKSNAYFDGSAHGGVTYSGWGGYYLNTSPMVMGFSATSGSPLTVYVDLLSASSPGNIVDLDGSYYTGRFGIGCLNNSGNATPEYYFNGRVAEVITYSSPLSAAQRARIYSYLAIKYGITLGHNVASGGTRTNYVNTAGTSIWTAAVAGDPMYDYHNDVAGVGRQDNEGLHQRQSVSQNPVTAPAFQVTMGLGTIAADNTSNPNNVTNAAYMLWGHNGADATAWSVSVSGSALPELCRVARIWCVQETNTVGTMKVRIPNAAFGGSSPTVVYMITSNDATFDNSDTRTAMTLSGSNWDCNYDFSNQQYFTFCRDCQLLPVELLSFNSACIDDVPVLSWSTATETNNSHFVLSRSENQHSFEPVAVITGSGNSNTIKEYEYADTEAPAENNCYYKLTQYDFDGTENSIGLLFSDCRKDAVLDIISFSSTETGDRYLNFYTDFDGTHKIEIFNTDGQLIFSGNYNVCKGNSIIRDQSWGLLKGVVIVRISTPKTSFSKTFSL